MLSAIHSYEDQTTLIMGSGVQFLDFAVTFVVKGKSGAFANIGDAGPIARLEEDERTGKLHFSFDTRKQPSQATLDIGVDQSLKLLLDTLMLDEAALSQKDFDRLAAAVEEDYLDIPTRRKRYEKMKANPYFNALQIKFAYALTCHKTQGGQWPMVFVDAGISKVEQIDRNYLRWLYTAVTRATEKLFLVSFVDDFFEEE